MACSAMQCVPFFFFFILMLFFFSLPIQAKDDGTRTIVKKVDSTKPPKSFEESKPPKALKPVHRPIQGPRRPPKASEELKKSKDDGTRNVVKKVPTKLPPKSFEEEKPPYNHGLGPKRPPKAAFEESKPPHLEHPSHGPLRGPHWPPKAFEGSKPPHHEQGYFAHSHDEQATMQTENIPTNSFGRINN
ncbi:hypothetical protein Dimus_017198 [Dionaea muscipula]